MRIAEVLETSIGKRVFGILQCKCNEIAGMS